MRISIFKIIAAVLVLCKFNAVAQVTKDAVDRFNNQQKLLVEKIYVHTDKSQYFLGDYLWFKLYNLRSSSPGFSPLSKVAYIELLDANNKVKKQAMIALNDGKGNGSMKLVGAFETGIHNITLALIVIFNFFEGLGGMALVAAWYGIWDLITAYLLAHFWSRRANS